MRLTLSVAAPSADSDGDHPQLLDRNAPDLLLRRGILRVLDGLGDHDHRVDEQAGQNIEVLGAPTVQSRESRKIGGELVPA